MTSRRNVAKVEEDRALVAFELACAADEAADELERIKLALRAVRLDPYCLDARLILAEAAGGPTDEYIGELREIVALGERQLEHRFQHDRGQFWGVTETRPCMRVRLRLAEELHKANRTKQAIAEYAALMELDERDSMGNRHWLLGCYLEVGDLEGARRILKDCADETTPMIAWGAVLERFLSANEPEATALLDKARERNRFVESLLSGRHRVPEVIPNSYSPGDFSEAAICYDAQGRAWKVHPTARRWLRAQEATRK